MKRILLISIILLTVLLSVFADTYSYNGSGSEFAGASVKLSLSVTKDTWLKAIGETADTSVVFVGFYDKEDKDSTTDSSDTLKFTEIYGGTVKSGGTNYYKYTADASFMIYIYCLSNSAVTVKLEWTNMTNTDSKVQAAITSSTNPYATTISYGITKEIAYLVKQVGASDSISSGTVIYTSNPSDGIFDHEDISFTAKAAYRINADTVNNWNKDKKTFTGTMTVKVSSN